VPGVVGGDSAAWHEFVTQLEPRVLRLLRRSRTLGPMRTNADDCRAVMISVLERLKKDDYRGLRLFQPWMDAHPGKDFGDWIRIVTINMARDHVSARLGGGGLNKRMLNTLASLLPDGDDHRLAYRPAMTHEQLARELLDHAERALDTAQLLALRRWMEGASFGELAAELGASTPREAEKIVRAALAKLRRQFGDDDGR
jgi:hypothetical protein